MMGKMPTCRAQVNYSTCPSCLVRACSQGLLLMNVSRRACGCGMSRKVVWKSSGSPGRRSQMGHVSFWHAGQFEVASTSYADGRLVA